jgi:hypothetical protein
LDRQNGLYSRDLSGLENPCGQEMTGRRDFRFVADPRVRAANFLGVAAMARDQAKKTPVVATDIERLRRELDQLFKNARPVEDQGSADRSTVIKGK